MKDKTIYIAGPMTDYPASNFALFDAVRDALTALGWTVVSPADLDRAEGFNPLTNPSAVPLEYESCLRRDEVAIRGCAAIGMLPGWRLSRGANREKALSVSLGHKTYRCWWDGPNFRIEEVKT